MKDTGNHLGQNTISSNYFRGIGTGVAVRHKLPPILAEGPNPENGNDYLETGVSLKVTIPSFRDGYYSGKVSSVISLYITPFESLAAPINLCELCYVNLT